MSTLMEKTLIIIKDAQSGKTFLMINQILIELTNNIDEYLINIIFCGNKINLAKQTQTRVNRRIKDEYDDYDIDDDTKGAQNELGGKVIEFSSKSRKCRDKDKLKVQVLTERNCDLI